MGNTAMTSCCYQTSYNSRSTALMVKLIFYGSGETRALISSRRKRIAGEIMFEFPDHMVCHADSFFIGHPIPSLSMDDPLMAGQTYFVLPLDYFSSCTVLSISSLASLGSSNSTTSSNKPALINFKECPLQYVKGSDGRVLIKVTPEFIIKLMKRGQQQEQEEESSSGKNYSVTPSHGFLCSTPELKKHYDQLVGLSKVQAWSPKLETISEYKIRYSPCRFLGFERKLGEA